VDHVLVQSAIHIQTDVLIISHFRFRVKWFPFVRAGFLKLWYAYHQWYAGIVRKNLRITRSSGKH
jgi:hypothetical protein